MNDTPVIGVLFITEAAEGLIFSYTFSEPHVLVKTTKSGCGKGVPVLFCRRIQRSTKAHMLGRQGGFLWLS